MTATARAEASDAAVDGARLHPHCIVCGAGSMLVDGSNNRVDARGGQGTR